MKSHQEHRILHPANIKRDIVADHRVNHEERHDESEDKIFQFIFGHKKLLSVTAVLFVITARSVRFQLYRMRMCLHKLSHFRHLCKPFFQLFYYKQSAFIHHGMLINTFLEKIFQSSLFPSQLKITVIRYAIL